MTAFATADDLAARLGLTLTEDEQTRATTLLEQASGDIRDELDPLKIDLVADDELLMRGTTDERILLPGRPVVSVASVELDGIAISDWYLAGNVIVRRGRTLTIVDGFDSGQFWAHRGFGYEAQQLRIVYTHGFAPEDIPARVARIAVEMVVRVWVNPGSLVQERIGPTETEYSPRSGEQPRGLQLTEHERRALRRLFGSRSGSVWMGS